MRTYPWAALLACLGVLPLLAGDATQNPLEPRTATLSSSALSLRQALDELRAQTGNAVRDLRSSRTDPTLRLPRTHGQFWPLLDEIGKAAGAGITPYGPDGSVALVETPYRAVPTTYSGLFRLALKRVATSIDFETKAHLAHVTLDVAWEPRFQPFYLDVSRLAATYAGGQRVSPSERGPVAVAGRTATELDLRLPAPDRASPRIETLEGALSVIGPARMLGFTFAKLAPIKKDQAPRQETQDGVTVSLTQLVAGRDRWSVDVRIENPPGGPELESFQSWLDNNKIALVREAGGKKITWSPEPGDEQQLSQLTARRAAIRYNFTIEPGRDVGGPADWTLHYRTPGRIVKVEVPFTFKDVPLP